MNISLAPWILMAWCLSTRTSVATVLSMYYTCIYSSFCVKHLSETHPSKSGMIFFTKKLNIFYPTLSWKEILKTFWHDFPATGTISYMGGNVCIIPYLGVNHIHSHSHKQTLHVCLRIICCMHTKCLVYSSWHLTGHKSIHVMSQNNKAI